MGFRKRWICPEHFAMEITKIYTGPHNEKGSNYFSALNNPP